MKSSINQSPNPELFPLDLFNKLGFDQILEWTSAECQTEGGREFLLNTQFLNNEDLIRSLLKQTSEFQQVISFDQGFPDENLPHIPTFLNRALIDGAYLDEDQFFSVLRILKYFNQVIGFFSRKEEQYPELSNLLVGRVPDKQLVDQIQKIIDERGNIRPNASPELMKIRERLLRTQTMARKSLETIYRNAKNMGWVGDGQVSVRDGRLVIPLLAEHKRKIKGFIHDESATGQTVYLEPAEILDLNNEVRNSELAQSREIRNILIGLTTTLRPHVRYIENCYAIISELDFIRAKARFANKIQAISPIISNSQSLLLKGAVHPVLYLNHKKAGKSIVPLDLILNRENHILVISGPNAGGKSVCLKTVGLLQLMFQSGFLIPVKEGTQLPVFSSLFVDIGDAQSIENDLSTYSSHLSYMKHFVENAYDDTLFLIDEFGTGTDPHYGGPIAESILEHLRKKSAYGIVNTHYSNLKVYATNTQGIVNGAMGFDAETLSPQYKLSMGAPGSSFAFEIARKIGLSSKILDEAIKKVGAQDRNMDDVLLEINKERQELEQMRKLMEMKDQMLAELMEKTRLKEEELTLKKAKILEDARLKAKELLSDVNRKIENTIQEIKHNQAQKTVTKELRQALEDFKTEVLLEVPQTTSPKEKKQKPVFVSVAIVPGLLVQKEGHGSVGKVVEIKKQQALVEIGDLKMWMPLSSLHPALASNKPKATSNYQSGVNYVSETVLDFNPNLDLRGMRTDEAMQEMERFIDRALVAGYSDLRILHGKGDGILRKFIRNYLNKIQAVEKVENDHADRGGDGISIVKLR